MSQDQKPEEARMEALKRKHGIDEIVAERYHLSKQQVEKDLDPRIVRLMLEFLNRRQ